jgi:hypothetical protein
MTELLDLEFLPTPPAVTARPRRRNRVWLSLASGVAGALGFAATAVISDIRADDSEQTTATSTALPVAVLAPVGADGGLSSVASEYAVAEWSSATSEGILGAWGAVTTGVVSGGQAVVAPLPGTDLLQDDPRQADPAAPGFVDPCAVREAAADDDGVACPDEVVAAAVLADGAAPPNAVSIEAYPATGVRARGCDFGDLGDGEIPMAVVTSRPGSVQLVVGSEEVSASTSDAEREAWELWNRRPLGVRPDDSFVVHCLAVPAPPGPGPFPVRAVATDDEGREVVAESTLAPAAAGGPLLSVTPIDPTMVRVDIPLPAGTSQASVTGAPLRSIGGNADCSAITPELQLVAAAGWRRGATAVETAGAAERGSSPWLRDTPRMQRVTVPLPEGETSLLCVRYDGAEPWLTRLLVDPPDARRLTLAVTELSLQGTPPTRAVLVTARLVQLRWTPCGAVLAAPIAARTEPGPEGVLCSSGGDIGALSGTSGLAEVSVGDGQGAAHTVRIVLTPRGRGDATESYRIPIPEPDLEGVLCTPGGRRSSCVEPDASAILGSVVVTATWSDGPVGPARWSVRTPAF